ncbi:hypothetical protein FBY37_0197 [Streptomyces sp. SLBN-134]|nr:hypothetical protein FBY37_0197 [Streptomyces sp. SLBN-134]
MGVGRAVRAHAHGSRREGRRGRQGGYGRDGVKEAISLPCLS